MVVGVGGAAGEVFFQDWEGGAEPRRIVNVYVGHKLVASHEEGKLQVPEVVVGLETPGMCKPLKLCGEAVQDFGDGVEQPRVDVVLRLLAQLFIHESEKPIPAQLSYLLDERQHGLRVVKPRRKRSEE